MEHSNSNSEGDELDALMQKLNSLQETINAATEKIQPLAKASQDLRDASQKAYQEYSAIAAQNNAKIKELEEAQYESQKTINSAKQELASTTWKINTKKKEIEQQKREERRNKDLALLHNRWDMLTIGAPWREWAKDHQIEAGHYLTENRKVILADPMGLGKTLSVISATDMAEAATRKASKDFPFLGEESEQYDHTTGEYNTVIVNGVTRPVGKKIVYFCPSSLIRNVMQEFRMWTKHRSVTYIGGMTKAEREFAFEFVLKDQAEFVVICNYEAWRRDSNLIQQFIELDPDTVIIDEAHNVKNTKSSAYRGIKRIIDQADPEYVIPMTGTPILNRPQELFSLLTLVNPNEFYHLNDFLYNFCEQDDEGFWKFQPGGLDRVARKIRKNFMRRTKDQAGIELPDKTIIHHDLEVDTQQWAKQADAREQMRKYATIIIDEDKAISAAAAIAMFTRLRQIETWPAGIEMRDPITKEVAFRVEVEESQKLDYVISPEPDEDGTYSGLIPEAIEDERIVLFSQFKAPLQELKRRIEKAGYSAVVLDGSVSPQVREEITKDFDRRYTPDRSRSRWDVVLCNYRVGGVGLNLTAATQLIVLDEEWNPGKRDQAYDRIHRIGQEQPVTINVIRNQKTIDDWLANIMATKEDIVDGFNTQMVSMDEFKNFLDDSGLV